jgi:hypothetical protein
MIDAAVVDATAKGILSRENLIDEGLLCDLDSEADREGDVPGIVLSIGLRSWVSEFSCVVIPPEARRFCNAVVEGSWQNRAASRNSRVWGTHVLGLAAATQAFAVAARIWAICSLNRRVMWGTMPSWRSISMS